MSPPEIHPAASTGFARAADAYERGRPDYPDEAVTWIAREVGLHPGRRLIDLAAGTGKLTRLLVATGATVVAVEPIAEMRALIEGVDAVDGRAEAMPLPEGWADAVTVGQAFHWFANEEALTEIHRVLAPDGALVLIWNGRERKDPLQAAVDALLDPLAGDVKRLYDGAWRAVLMESPLFGPLVEASFPHEQQLDEQGLVDRFCSTSYVASAPEEDRTEVEAGLRALVRERGGKVRVPYTTCVVVTRRRAAPPRS